MKRTEKHNESVSQTVLQFIRNKGLMRSGEHVIVAVSGGIDSMVLLDILSKLRGVLKVHLSVAHVNHRLRGRSSDADENLVKRKAAEYGISCVSARVETNKHSINKKISIQEAARELRYGFFDKLKKSLKADLIVTAHNANDNAETMLFHFFRGSGLQGLSGIPVHRDHIIRPLMSVTRSEIEQYAKMNRVLYREDASNLKDDYTRNFIRKNIIPLVEKRINPSLTQTLQRESRIFSSLADFIAGEVDKHFEQAVKGSTVSISELRELHPFLQRAVMKRVLEKSGIEPSYAVIESIADLMNNQKGSVVEINNQYNAVRIKDAISVHRRNRMESFEYLLPKPATIRNESFTFSVAEAKKQNKREIDSSVEYIDAGSISFPLTVRSWKPGDYFIPLGMKGKKKLSDFFGERKLSAEQKSEVPIVLSGDTVVWIGGMRLDDRVKITERTRSTYKLTIQFHDKKNGHRQ